VDPTTLGSRLHVLCCSVLSRGMATPVAWKILPGGTHQEAWHPHWCDLLGRLHRVLAPTGKCWS
jgi:hypothetical protein